MKASVKGVSLIQCSKVCKLRSCPCVALVSFGGAGVR